MATLLLVWVVTMTSSEAEEETVDVDDASAADDIVKRIYNDTDGDAAAFTNAHAVLAVARRHNMPRAHRLHASDIQSALDRDTGYALFKKRFKTRSARQPVPGYGTNTSLILARPTTIAMDTAFFTVHQSLGSGAGSVVFVAVDSDFR